MTPVARIGRSLWRPLCVAIAVVAAFTLVASLYAALVPLGQPIDEPSHLGYVHLVADHLALPSATVPEKQQPPLYYLMSAGLLHLGLPDQWIRSVSVLFGAAAIVAVMLGARALLPRRPWVAVGAGAIVAAVPAFEAGSGAISDDSLSWLCGALLLLMSAVVLRDPRPSMRRALVIGAVVGVSLLAKETTWVLCALLLAVVVWRWREAWSPRLAACVGVPIVALSGWWFARNLATFHRLTPPLSPITNARQYLRHAGQLRGFVSASVRSITGPETTTGLVERSGWASALTWLLAAVFGVLSIVAAALVAKRYHSLSPSDRLVAVVAAAAVAITVVAYVANSVFLDLQPQVRYLAVAAVVPATAWAYALAHLGRAVRRGAPPAGLAALMVALDVDSLRVAASVR